jgi:hypothetical protein
MKRVLVLSEIAPYQQFSEPQNDPTLLPPESWCVTNCITFQKRNKTAVKIGKMKCNAHTEHTPIKT